ncbi:IS1182 family transposase [Desulfitobacterium hafniense]|uniref:IS1182 family transposase n=1 Tax=Desulfitobacterium hafniense TaxID=49338 RepID=UPI0003715124|nr:IS1182 family transposase [Desulfitobacterium hafniense]
MQLKIDEFFAEKVIPAGDSVRLLDEIMEEMDYTPLFRAYKRTGRPPATHPVTLMKIMVYASMEGNFASRAIASSCNRDINYIWLLNGEKAPNHSEIARFRSKRLTECGEEFFYQLVKKLSVLGEIQYEHLFVDGTKIEANANKYSFVWKKSTTKYETRLLAKLEKLGPQLCSRYAVLSDTPEEVLRELESRITTPFVHGRGKRKSELQKDIELLRELLLRKNKYAGYQETFKGRNSFSKTDPDATFMHMKEDHMRNAQLKPGYNIQFGVEGEYITGVHVCSERSDQLALIPLLETMQAHLKQRYKDVTADAGYESEENYTYFEGKTTECYIKPQNYERSKTKKYKSNMALRENMLYDPSLDEYTCQAGKKLRAVYVGKRKNKSGFESEITYYESEGCEGCPHKKSCTRSKGNRTLQVSKKFIEQREQSLKRITSEKGILLRINRSIQSEGAFGVIKQDYGFRQLLLRGNKKVLTEILWVAMGYNINKLHNKIQQNRTGRQLFEKLTA